MDGSNGADAAGGMLMDAAEDLPSPLFPQKQHHHHPYHHHHAGLGNNSSRYIRSTVAGGVSGKGWRAARKWRNQTFPVRLLDHISDSQQLERSSQPTGLSQSPYGQLEQLGHFEQHCDDDQQHQLHLADAHGLHNPVQAGSQTSQHSQIFHNSTLQHSAGCSPTNGDRAAGHHHTFDFGGMLMLPAGSEEMQSQGSSGSQAGAVSASASSQTPSTMSTGTGAMAAAATNGDASVSAPRPGPHHPCQAQNQVDRLDTAQSAAVVSLSEQRRQPSGLGSGSGVVASSSTPVGVQQPHLHSFDSLHQGAHHNRQQQQQQQQANNATHNNFLQPAGLGFGPADGRLSHAIVLQQHQQQQQHLNHNSQQIQQFQRQQHQQQQQVHFPAGSRLLSLSQSQSQSQSPGSRLPSHHLDLHSHSHSLSSQSSHTHQHPPATSHAAHSQLKLSTFHHPSVSPSTSPHTQLHLPSSCTSSSSHCSPVASATLHSAFAHYPVQSHFAPLHHSTPPSAQITMSMDPPFDGQDDELARMQELSNNWEPEATGPLVSERIASSNLTTEYADADPVYQVKTASLPQKYAQYRTCRGDGHCGWRAIAFCYYETLMRTADRVKFLEEETRLKSMQNILKDIGLQQHLYEDFVEDALELLKETASATDEGAALLAAFNDFGRSQSIITFLKLLTSAWIQKHPDEYSPFIDIPVAEYCKNRIEPAVAEIEHVGLSALVDLLAKPAGIAVEVLYLDRSPGEEVTTYRFDPLDPQGAALVNPPTFQLLYRPGHYDILYRLQDLPVQQPPSTQQDVFVALSHRQTPEHSSFAKVPFSNGFEIPGAMDFFPQEQITHPAWAPLLGHMDYSSPNGQSAATSIASHIATNHSPTRDYPAPPNSVHDFGYGTATLTMNTRTPTTPIAPAIQQAIPQAIPAYPCSVQNGTMFRPSKYAVELDYISMNRRGLSLCQTSIFKNSHFNTAHFANPDFSPEQWKPEDEYNSEKRKRSSS
ncbi:hypothetical protein BT63DRAFT_449942 [Microthyrium microscopicum]|uniref:ubiquitinyl hydrolase 1 n=1 Tax=Microthyrium microscopicum TaxID=703497 RepID=A0A6A6URP1_9PEZI|nr:hypothetical protein BT63DRAFT_449942 [Microthyrium microscopicum]